MGIEVMSFKFFVCQTGNQKCILFKYKKKTLKKTKTKTRESQSVEQHFKEEKKNSLSL